MSRFGQYLREYRHRRHVRPWALSAPILVLLICLPLLRPLRHPGLISDDELSRLATIQAIVEHDTLAIDDASYVFRHTRDKIQVGEHEYSSQPPVMAAILSSTYRVMYGAGLRLDDNPVLVPYLLT